MPQDITICLNQSYAGVKASLELTVVPKIIQALGDKNGRSFVVEFNREAAPDDPMGYKDWAKVFFKAQAPIVFSEPETNRVGFVDEAKDVPDHTYDKTDPSIAPDTK